MAFCLELQTDSNFFSNRPRINRKPVYTEVQKQTETVLLPTNGGVGGLFVCFLQLLSNETGWQKPWIFFYVQTNVVIIVQKNKPQLNSLCNIKLSTWIKYICRLHCASHHPFVLRIICFHHQLPGLSLYGGSTMFFTIFHLRRTRMPPHRWGRRHSRLEG